MKKRITTLLLAVIMVFGACSNLIACKDDPTTGPVIDNETTRLVLATSELDGVFNPFYSSAAADGSVVGMTQIGMLSSDKDGKVAYGKDEACIVLDYESIPVVGTDGNIEKTIYRFVLKNDLKFSNGSPLTMRDVLFNLYVYLDPTYYGSSTIYSTEIIGLKEYRTQTTNEKEQEGFLDQFLSLADLRVQRLQDLLTEIYENHKEETLTEAQMVEELTALMNDYKEWDESYSTVVEDYELAKKYFKEELQTDYNYAKGTAEDIVFTDKAGNKVHLNTDTEAFLYNEGFIKWIEDEYRFDYSLGKGSANWTMEEAINAIYTSFIPHDVISVIRAWNTANELITYFSFLEQQKYFEGIEEKITSVSGIKYANKTEANAALGFKVSTVIDDDNWYSYLKLFASLSVKLGYSGFIVFIDECVNLYKIPNRISREANYEKLLAIFNDTLQGKAKSLGVIFGGTPQFLEDTRRGLFSYDALKSRLADSRYATVGGYQNLSSPVIRLRTLSGTELLALVKRLTNLYAMRDGAAPLVTDNEIEDFVAVARSRAGADEMLTPREIIRDFLSFLNVLRDNKNVTFSELIRSARFETGADPDALKEESKIVETPKKTVNLFDIDI